ncbi:MAG: FHA domain-containing protein [Actinomycetaceae bacterium]|nr:FHA domain-containing protein [Actinomycetaceae bacterium]MDO5747002.1 FHA domain-containing protein [Actinomycetaceae bacterium]
MDMNVDYSQSVNNNGSTPEQEPIWSPLVNAWVYPSQVRINPQTGQNEVMPPLVWNPATNSWEVLAQPYVEQIFGDSQVASPHIQQSPVQEMTFTAEEQSVTTAATVIASDGQQQVQSGGEQTAEVDSHEDDNDATVLSTQPIYALLRLDDGHIESLSGPVILGRRPKRKDDYPDAVPLQIVDTAKSMSKIHALLRPVEEGVEVTDLRSTNGTWVVFADGRREKATSTHCLIAQNGSQIHFGNRHVTVEIE